jgi:hypothetical protein
MFARRVYMHLKPNSVAEFTQRLEKDILPLLRKQKGFQDEITFVGQGGREAFGISLWDTPGKCRRLQPRNLPRSDEVSSHGSRGSPPG